MRIIPAIDIIDGKCVRLSKGDYTTQKIYNHDPLELAKEFEANGIQYLHLVDLDGAKSKHIVHYKILENIALHTQLKIDFGGGVKSNQDVKIAFECGANQVIGGSIAIENPTLFLEWLDTYSYQKIILGADAHARKIATQGWLNQTDIDVVDFITYFEQKGIHYVICTDIAKDGMLAGTANDLYQEIMKKTSVKLIASGGVAGLDDLLKLIAIGCEGAIIGKAIYEGKILLSQLKLLC